MITNYSERFELRLGGYQHKNDKTSRTWRPIEYGTAAKLEKGCVVQAILNNNTVVPVKVTSVKTYKRRGDVVVKTQYGLYAHGTTTFKAEYCEGATLVEQVLDDIDHPGGSPLVEEAIEIGQQTSPEPEAENA